MRLTKCLGAILRIEVKEEQMKVDCLHESLFLKAIDHETQSTIKITISLAISKSINHKPRQLKNLQRTDHKDAKLPFCMRMVALKGLIRKPVEIETNR